MDGLGNLCWDIFWWEVWVEAKEIMKFMFLFQGPNQWISRERMRMRGWWEKGKDL